MHLQLGLFNLENVAIVEEDASCHRSPIQTMETIRGAAVKKLPTVTAITMPFSGNLSWCETL
jgi:hypothetical protein